MPSCEYPSVPLLCLEPRVGSGWALECPGRPLGKKEERTILIPLKAVLGIYSWRGESDTLGNGQGCDLLNDNGLVLFRWGGSSAPSR